MEIKDLIHLGRENLKDIEYADPNYEVSEIIYKLTGKDLTHIHTHLNESVDEGTVLKFKEILDRRKKGEPLQYILNAAYFYGREYFVDRGVLIPRKDSEIPCEKIINLIKKNKLKDFFEIGVGSGCFSITVNLETGINVKGVDISDDALKIAEINTERLKASCYFFESDLFSNVVGKFDIIYSNPPYIRSDVIDKLQIEVKDFEPRLALDGGEDGLKFYRDIAKAAPLYLKEGGYLAFEIGYDQRADIENILRENNFINIESFKDYGDKDRVVLGVRS